MNSNLMNRQTTLQGFSGIIREQGHWERQQHKCRWTSSLDRTKPCIWWMAQRNRRHSSTRPSCRKFCQCSCSCRCKCKVSKYISLGFKIIFLRPYIKRRSDIFRENMACRMPCTTRRLVSHTPPTPLRVAGEIYASGYEIALSWTLNQFVICKGWPINCHFWSECSILVKSLYAKTGSKSGQYSHVLVKYHGCHTSLRKFWAPSRLSIPCYPTCPITSRFPLWPSPTIRTLKHTPEVTSTSLKISPEDWKLFKDIKYNSKTILEPCKALAGRKKLAEGDEE